MNSKRRIFFCVLLICFWFILTLVWLPAFSQRDTLPPPNATKSVMNFSKVIGWENGKIPGSLLVTDYASDVIWRVAVAK